LLPQGLVQAVTRHDVGFTTEDASRILLHIHQFKEAEPSLFVIKKQVNVGIFVRLAARVEPNI
jgi:hypothetical protein